MTTGGDRWRRQKISAPSSLLSASLASHPFTLTKPSGLTQALLNLLAQELHRPHDLLVRDQTAGVELGENAGEAELVPQPRETIGDHLRCADDRPGATRLVPAKR